MTREEYEKIQAEKREKYENARADNAEETVVLKTYDGKELPAVSKTAYYAIQNGISDYYTPKNDNEKTVLKYISDLKAEISRGTNREAISTVTSGIKNEDYRNKVEAYLSKNTDKKLSAEIKPKVAVKDNSTVVKKYGIDPDSFTQADLDKWAKEHNYVLKGNGSYTYYAPEYEGGFLGIGGKKKTTDEEDADLKVLSQLAENNLRRNLSKGDAGRLVAGAMSFADGATFGLYPSLADLKAEKEYKKSGLDEKNYVSTGTALENTQNEHKKVSTASNIAGSLVALRGLSKAVGAATGAVKWISGSPQWVQSAINSGITFAVSSGAETAFDGGNFEDVLKSAGINLVGGAVGGGVSGAVGSIGEKLLFDKGLQHKIIPEMVRNGVTSAAFAGSKTASTYFLYPEDYRPTSEEMTKNIITAFAFGAISSGINTIKTSAQNKKYLDDLYQKMASDYESMAKENISNKNDTAGIQKFAKNVVGYSNAMEAYLTGKEYNAIIDGKTYTFTPNKIRLVGQDKYVNSILGEIDTIRNNANAVLNGIETSPVSVSTSSAANTAGMSAGAVQQTASVAVSNTDSTPVSSNSDMPTAVSVAAAEAVTPKNTTTVDTATPQTAVKINASEELSEIMDSEPIATFTPENADEDIKKLEDILILQGADDTSRKEIIDTAVEIEKTLDGSDKTIRSIFNNVLQITGTAIDKIQSQTGQAGLSGAYWKLFGENFKTVPTGNAKESINLVTEYSNAYAQALKNSNPQKYNSVMLSQDGQDLSAELPKTIMQNNIPNTVQNAGQYRLIATQIKNIINAADVRLEYMRTGIYGKNSAAPAGNNAESTEAQTADEPKNITLSRLGDFYEAFGDEALEIAEKLNLTPTYKTVDGVKTAMVGFPVHVLEQYQGKLGDGYNLLVLDNKDAVFTNQNNAETVTADAETVQGSEDITTNDNKVVTAQNMYEIMEKMGLTYDEQRAILEYESSGSYKINDKLRRREKLSEADIKLKNDINSALDKFPIFNGKVYRQIGFESKENLNKFIGDIINRETFETDTFMSASKSVDGYVLDKEFKVCYEIESYSSKDVSKIGLLSEDEVLFKQGTKFVVASVNVGGNEIKILCEELNSDGKKLRTFNGETGNKAKSNENAPRQSGVGASGGNSTAMDSIRERSGEISGIPDSKSESRGGGNDRRGLSDSVELRKDNRNVGGIQGVLERDALTENHISLKKAATADSVLKTTENKSAVPYTNNEKQNWESSKDIIVYESDEQFEAFVEKVLKNEDTNKKIYFGKIPNETAQMVHDKTGIDVSGYNIALKGYEIRKILLNSHGNENVEIARGQEPITIDDLKNIPSVITNPDNVSLSEKEYEGKPALLFEKTIDGKNYVVAYVTRKHHDIAIQTMYKKRSLATAENANALSSTSETTNSTASDNSISQNNDIVNNSVRNNTENDTLNLTDKCKLIATKHTATGEDLWVLTLKEKLSQDEYKDLNGKVKAVGGYYSRFAKTPDGKAIPGFVFKTEPTEKELSVFNDFFNNETVEDTVSAETDNTEQNSADVEKTDTKPDLKVGDEVKLSDHEKQTSDEQLLKSKSGSDIIEENTEKDGIENVESQSEILDRESRIDGGRLHAGADGTDVETRTEEADEPHRDSSGKGLSESIGTDGNRPDVGNDSEGVHGTDDADNAAKEVRGTSAGDGRGGLLGRGNGTVQGVGRESGSLTDNNIDEPKTIETAVKTVEKKRPSNKGNFLITDDIATEFDNTPPSAKDNIEAIELLLTLENEGRTATAEEKKTLAKYKGWGGIDTRYLPYELSSRFSKLFDWEQRKAMQSSQNNAFFTPTKVIDAMYTGLKRMGFKGGNVLETSMGVGNFFGRMPSSMSAKSALTGVELESYTARIAQYLYPGATVINKPFQDVAIKNGSYDLVIGNVPFGQNKISYNKKKYSLHNFFIISSLDKVRDGGIVAVITSAGTLDSHSIDARKAIMDRADVVACYKLPEKVFSRNASTDVQSDLLILRKRASDEKPKGDSILDTITTAQGFRINEYFDKHPENVLGTLAKGHNAWGEITTVQSDGSFYDKLNTAMKKLPKDLISGKVDLKPIETIVSLSDKPRFFEENGKLYADDGAGTATEVSKNRVDTVRDYIAVRDAYKELLNAYENGEIINEPDGTVTIREMSDEDIKPLRDKLSKVYDDFYEKHGAITGDGKKKIGTKKSTNNTFLEADADYYLVGGLERYDAENRAFVKSALFEKDTLRKKRVTSVDVASDALAVSLNESGRIDFARMQELTGKTEKQLAEELKGEIVLTPDGDYALTDIYLSGNIYEKLEAVKGKPEFKEQQEMLEKVIPTPKSASDITVKLGANYIDSKHIEQFAREVLNSHITVRKDISGKWVIEGVRQSRYGDVVNVKYGCGAFNAVQLLEKILNDGEITATKKVGIGRDAATVFDSEMTDIAKQKADDIRDAFENWIFSDSERWTEIVDNYNRTYNNYRPLDYARIAEKLSFDSMDETLKAKLYPHQKKGIARFLFGGNVLFAHGVGTGKTFEMIASVMEAKRMGIINKAAMVVPNNKVVDFKNDIAQAYPNAKVLVIDTANKKRQTMLGLVNSNDWDIVLIARTTFTKIPVSPEFQTHYIAQQLEDLELQIAEAENDKSVSKRQLKGMITQRDNLEQKIKDLDAETKRDTNSVDFEKLGIDCICADEAHNYKSIMTPTKLSIKGLINRSNAQMANDMLMKLDYLRSIDGKIVFGTGTPITNTVSEIYNMMRMVRPDILEDAGIHSLDEWVNTFAKIDTVTEIGIDNQIKNKSTQIIRSFINVNEMVGMFRQFADIVFTTDVVENLPKAVYKDIEISGTNEHKQIENQISEILAKTKKADLLKVHGQLMSMADVAAVDLRMLAGAESEYNIFKDYSLDELDYKDSKINTMCDIVYDEYTTSGNIKGTQIIFCDKGSGSGTVYSFNLHKDIMQKLVERGIPEEQIVIVKNQSDAQLEALYDKVNAGEVRVLIGTSQKMAEGLNVQKRVVAIHHPTVTYKPSDWEQGNARGVRAGNINDEVRIYRYLQKNTFDSHKWQAQDRKSEMINKALRGEAVAEMEDIGADEDGGAGVDAATAMAITSGNPLVKEKIDIDKEVVRLKTLQRSYLSEVYHYQDAISKNPNMIRQLTSYADNIERDIALRNKYNEKTSIVIKGKTFEKQTDANKALSEAVKTAPKNGQYTKLGAYNGFDIMFKGDTGGMNYSLILKGSNEYTVEYAGNGNNMSRFAGVMSRLDTELTRVRERVETLKTDLEFAKKEVSKPFEKEKELTEALEKQRDITYRYEHYGEKTAATENTETESTDTVHSSKDIAGGSIGERKYSHLYDEKKVSKEYLNSVDFEIENAVISIRKGDIGSVPDVIEVTKLDKKTIKAISDFVGYDISGYVCKIERDRLVHIEKRHGINGSHDQSLSDPKDTARMGYIVNNSDNIEWVTDEKGNRVYDSKYNDRNNKIAPVFVMEKRIDGTYSVSQVVPDSKKKTLWVTSARIEKAAVGSQVPNDSNAIPQPTSGTPLVSSSAYSGIISQNENAVNNTVRKNGEKYSKDIADTDSVSRWTTERVGGNKDSKVNIADIVKGISDKFGIPIATGKVTDRQASGIYKDKPETIRTRIANNLPTISHELGHHLDKKYDLSKLESVKELRKAVSEEFLGQYPADAKNSEAVAEFVRIYLKNTNDANRLCPDFYSDFISSLSKEDLKSLNGIASSVNEYLSYNISERYDAAIVSSQKKEKVPFKEKWHKWYSDWVDAFHPQKQAMDFVEDATGQTLSGKDNAYILATNSLNAHTVANFLICDGFRDLGGNIVDAKSFVDSIGMVNSKDVKLLDKYLVLRHSLEWIAPEQEDVTAKRVFADDTLENAEEIKKQIAELEKAHPEIKTAAENLYEYQNNVIKNFVIPAGGMTEETLDMLNRKYPSYVPFYRAVGKKSGFAKGTFANQRSPIMRAKGSGALIISPTESIIRNTEKMVKFAMRNQVMGMWADYADTVDGFGQYMEKVAPDMIPHSINITSQKERFTDALQQIVNSGDDYFAVSDLFEEIFNDAVVDFTPIANANKKIVTVLRNGNAEYYQIHDDAFFNSIAELSPKQTEGLLKIMNSVMQPMKLLITQKNPIFATTNAIRDYGTAYKLSEINNPVTFAAQYVKALGGIITNSENYKQYKAMGGGHSSELSANVESISKTLRDVAQKDMGKARRLAYSVFRHPVETVAMINDAVESTPRYMEFMRTLNSGGDLQQAIYNADDLTTNFKRSGKGSTAKAVNKTIMFNNAAIQGLDKMFRTMTAKDPKKRYKTLLKWMLHALIMGIIGYIYNKEVDEEGYKNLSSYKKNNFYNYAIGDGKFVSLPKPRENALLDTFTERTIEYLFGDNENAFYDFGSYLGLQLLPPMLPDTLNPVEAVHSVGGSTIFGGLLDVGFNQDFKGTPIESKYDEYIPSNERYSESTTKLAYELGQTELARDLDMSPKKIDHLISSYTGILGQVNKAIFPMNDSRRDKSIGLRNKFISDSNYSTDVLNRMYENQEKAEKAFNYSGSVGDAVEYEKNSVITSYISGMNKAVRALPEDEQRSGRAYLLKALDNWEYDDSTAQSNMLSSLDGSTVSTDIIFDSLPSSELEWTVDNQKYVYQMTPQEYHKYISNYLTVIENARKHYGDNTVESYEAAKEAAKKYMSEYKKNVLKSQYLPKATAKTE